MQGVSFKNSQIKTHIAQTLATLNNIVNNLAFTDDLEHKYM